MKTWGDESPVARRPSDTHRGVVIAWVGLALFAVAIVVAGTERAPRVTTVNRPVSQADVVAPAAEGPPVTERDRGNTPYAHPRADFVAHRGRLATTLLDAPVMGPEHRDSGRLHDLVIDPGSALVRYAILSSEDESDVCAIPFRDLTLDASGNALEAPGLDADRLAAAPRFGRDGWPADPRYWDDADRRYGLTSAAGTGPPASRAVRAGFLLGRPITNANGEDLGLLEDLVVNVGTARLDYAIVRNSDRLQGTLVAVPIEAFHIGAGPGDKLVLDVEPTLLLRLAQFSSWPDVNDTASARRVQQGWKEVVGEARPSRPR